jgi:hypothetical protein
MKEIKIKVHLSIGYVNANHDGVLTVEVDDDATDDEIQEAADLICEDWANNFIEYGWDFKE